MEIKIKKLNEKAVIPKYAKTGDAGMDLTAISKTIDEHGNIVYGTGLAFEIPQGYVGLLFPRSSNAKKTLILSNSVGVLDSGYRGEVAFKFKPSLVVSNGEHTKGMNMNKPYADAYEIGERIGQIIVLPYPIIEFEEVEELTETERGNGGFGSTGK